MAIIDSNGYYFMEFIPGQTIKSIQDPDQLLRDWDIQKSFILGIISSMKNLIENQIFMLDLKSSNVIFDEKRKLVTLIDVGKSIFLEIGQNIEDYPIYGKICFTKLYCPPELQSDNGDKLNIPKAVSWLIGLTILEGLYKFYGCTNVKTKIESIKKPENKDLFFELDKGLNQHPKQKELTLMLHDLLKIDPKDRVDYNEALKNDVFLNKQTKTTMLAKKCKVLPIFIYRNF